MKKFTGKFLAVILMLLCLTGCSEYTSSYKAVGFVHSNTSKSAMMSFYSFDGRMVFKIKSSGTVTCSGALESGNATVYYGNKDTKKELFTIKAGEEIEAHSEDVESGTIYIIVETDGKCTNGSFDFKAE